MSEGATLTKEQCVALATACDRSPAEFCRVFLPEWFPSKMPWFHRGLAALRTGKLDFLLDFGEEWWPEDLSRGVPSTWTSDDLIKIITNFVIETKPAVKRDGVVIEPAELFPLFALELAPDGAILGISLTDPKLNNAFILPRGFSKTTLINAMNLSDALYQREKFILYVSETGPHAVAQLLTLRNQFENNNLIRLVFGDLVPTRSQTNKWGENEIEPLNGMRIAAIGSGGQIRGVVKDAIRPTRIVVDDLQTDEGCKSPTQRLNDVTWFVRVLLPARKMFGPDRSKLDMIGTLLHAEAILAILMIDPDWTRVRFGALDRQGDPLWAHAVDHVKLAELRAQAERFGQLDAFDFEYMSNVPMNDGMAFPLDKIVYVSRPVDWFVGKAVVCDPAISDNPKADFCTIGVVGIGKFGKVHLLDFHAEVGMEFDAQAEKFFEFHFAHCLDLPPENLRHGVEAVAYQRALISLIASKQHEKSRTWGQRAFFEVTPILHGKTGKLVRVQGLLSPRVKAGHVSFERHFPIMEGQLRDWPNGKKDAPDMLAMGLQLLDPFAALNSNTEGDPDDPDSANENWATSTPALPPLSKVLQGKTWRHAP